LGREEQVALKRGDALDWDAVVRKHNHRVVISLVALGLSIDRAEETAQNAWTRLIAETRQGKISHCAFPGLAIRQARFLALDLLRRQKIESRALTLLRATDVASTDRSSPEDRVLDREKLTRAIAAIELLPDRDRALFRAVYNDPSVPHAETARRFGLSVQRVRQILCEIRSHLRDVLEVK
jgi:RNA polymerase sigma factor (sigma-70 family)